MKRLTMSKLNQMKKIMLVIQKKKKKLKILKKTFEKYDHKNCIYFEQITDEKKENNINESKSLLCLEEIGKLESFKMKMCLLESLKKAIFDFFTKSRI